MKEYNTSKIRGAARRLDSIAEDLQTLGSSDVSKIRRSAKPLKGDTANALGTQIEVLAADLQKLRKGVDQCASALYEFARQLDIADEKAKALIQNK